MRVRGRRPRADRGTGIFGTTFGFVAFLILLLFTTQVLYGLYTRTTVTAIASDLAHRAASEGLVPGDPGWADRERAHEAEGRRRLGRHGDRVDFDLGGLDADGDGTVDTITVAVDADLPVLLPVQWSGFSPTSFTRTVRARVERVQVAAP